MPYFKDTSNKLHFIDDVAFLKFLPLGSVQITDTQAEQLISQSQNNVPSVVSMRQARLALLQAGLLSTVDAVIAASENEADKIEWEYAAEVNRNSPLVVNMKAGLNLTDAELDGLFSLAGSL